MKLYLCWVSDRLTIMLFILMGTKMCFREISSQEILTCRDKRIHEIIVQDADMPVNFSMCFVNININTIKVNLTSSFNGFNKSSDKYTFNWRRSNTSYYLHIVILNITQEDITEWTLTLKDKATVYVQSFSLSLPGSIDFSLNSYMEHNRHIYPVTCTAYNFPRKIQLIDRCGNTILTEQLFNSKNYQQSLSLVHEIDLPFRKLTLMALECKVYDFKGNAHSQFTDFKQIHANTRMCSIQDPVMKVNVYDTAKVIVQVLAYPEISLSVIVTNDTNPKIEDKEWKVNSRKLSEVLWSIELFKDNIQEEDMGNYSVKIKSTVEPSVELNISVVLKDPPKFLNRKFDDICPDTNTSVIYRLVSSGLPLSLPTDTSYKIDILPNNVSREYLVKLYIDNCKQFIEKEENFQFILQAGSRELIGSFYLKENNGTLILCEPHDRVMNLTTRIGENVTLNICIISESEIIKDNIGVNHTPYFLSIFSRYRIDITNEGNQYNIRFSIYNVTRSDIKFYILKIRDMQKNTIDLVINLFLSKEPPYLCDNVTTIILKGEEIEASFCIRSYPVLSRDIFINDTKYTIKGTNGGVIIDSNFVEESFSNYFHIKIPNVTENLTTLEIRVLSVTNFSFTFHLNITANSEITTTPTPEYTLSYTLSSSSISSIETTEVSPSIISLTPTEKANTDVIIISIIVVIVSIALAVVLTYFFCIRKKMVARRRRSGVSIRYLTKSYYNNVPELKKLNDYTEDNMKSYESKYENISTPCKMDNGNGNHLPDVVSGRFKNDQGLIYVTVDHSDFNKRSSQSVSAKYSAETRRSSQSVSAKYPAETRRSSQPIKAKTQTESIHSNYVSIDPLKTRHLQNKNFKS